MLTEKKMWALISKAGWVRDPDYKRINEEFVRALTVLDCMQLFEFIRSKKNELGTRFHKAWLRNPGIEVSDDGWWNLRAYKENFTYCCNETLLVKNAPKKDLPLLIGRVTHEDAKELLTKRLKRA